MKELDKELEDLPLREAKKYLGLMEAFEVQSGNMEVNLNKNKMEIIKEMKKSKDSSSEKLENSDKIIKSVIESDDLIEDFSLIRKNLRDNIRNTSLLLEKFGGDLGLSKIDEIPPDMVSAYSELIKSSNASMKLLIDSYSTVSKTQVQLKKLISLNKQLDEQNDTNSKNSTTVTNTVNFVGNTKDLLNSLEILRNKA